MGQKLHYACKRCLTNPQIFTTECGHHALESCGLVSVHKRVTGLTKHLTPSSAWLDQGGENELGVLIQS